jgi:hypothetical protein
MMMIQSTAPHQIDNNSIVDNDPTCKVVAQESEQSSLTSGIILDNNNNNSSNSQRLHATKKRRSALVVERPSMDITKTNNLTSINSGFLAGLFDDVTKISVLKELRLSSPAEEEGQSSHTQTTSEQDRSSKTDFMGVQASGRTSSPLARTVSPSSRSKVVVTDDEATAVVVVDPLQLLDGVSKVSMTSSNFSCDRPAKKSRLSMINVPSLSGLGASSSSVRGNLERVSYWNLTERSSTFHAQSRELFSSFTFSGASTTPKTANRETSLDQLFSQVAFLDTNNNNNESNIHHSNPATLALDALMETRTAASGPSNNNSTTVKSRMIKASTFNRFPILPCTISESSCGDLPRLARAPPAPRPVDRTNSNGSLDESSSFGWFVDTDEDLDEPVSPSNGQVESSSNGLFDTKRINPGDLAYQAPTAPKGRSIQDDAEIEWAQAADTVDSVLGDMF